MAGTRPKVSGYSHVALAVDDLAAARRFYGEVFGFEELRRPDLGVPGAWFRVGDLQLHLIETDELPTPGREAPHLALYVPTDRFDATVQALRDGGAHFLGDPGRRVDFGTTAVLAAFVRDPAGNLIELTDVGPG